MVDWAKVKLDVDKNLPFYQQISRKIRAMILSGELGEGERLPPSSELKRIFRVSAITVENGVMELVKEEMLCRRRRLGTFVASPQKPATPRVPDDPGSHGCINVIFNSNRPGGHGYFELLCGLEQACKADGFRTRFSIVNPDAPEGVADLTEGCDGIVLMGIPKTELIRELTWKKTPLVLFGDSADADPALMRNVDHVVHDDAGRAFLLVKHLVELGHRRILAVVTPAGTPNAANQEKGLKRAAKEFRLSSDELVVHPVADYLPEFGYKAAYASLCPASRPTACLTTDHDLAVGVINAARDLGLRVPENLSVVTFGSQFNCERSEPKLTCFAATTDEIARTAWRKLHVQIRNPKSRKGKTVIAGDAFFFGTSTMFRRAENQYVSVDARENRLIPS